MACFGLLLGVSYDFARVFRAYDYRRFFRHLLGRGWIAFEVLYVAMFALVLAVISAAAGNLFAEYLHFSSAIGVGVLLLTMTVLAFYGRQWVTRILTFKALLLSVVFLAYFVTIVSRAGPTIVAEVGRLEIVNSWALGSLRYALYSSVVVPAMLFATSAIQTRREAYVSGMIGAIAGMVPGVLLHLSFAVGYPAVLEQTIPAHWMISRLGIPLLTAVYVVVLFGCLLDTGLCFIQSVTERIDGWRSETGAPPISGTVRAMIAATCVAVCGGLSSFGVVRLISQGYGAMAWGFFILYVVPLLTVGLIRLIHARSSPDIKILDTAPTTLENAVADAGVKR
jgi:uncharacterized membrane protein YkvI